MTSNGDAAKDLRTNNVHHQVLQYSKSDATRSWPSISRAECLVSRCPCILLFPGSRSRYGEERSSMYLHFTRTATKTRLRDIHLSRVQFILFGPRSGVKLASNWHRFFCSSLFFPGARQSGSPFCCACLKWQKDSIEEKKNKKEQ